MEMIRRNYSCSESSSSQSEVADLEEGSEVAGLEEGSEVGDVEEGVDAMSISGDGEEEEQPGPGAVDEMEVVEVAYEGEVIVIGSSDSDSSGVVIISPPPSVTSHSPAPAITATPDNGEEVRAAAVASSSSSSGAGRGESLSKGPATATATPMAMPDKEKEQRRAVSAADVARFFAARGRLSASSSDEEFCSLDTKESVQKWVGAFSDVMSGLEDEERQEREAEQEAKKKGGRGRLEVDLDSSAETLERPGPRTRKQTGSLPTPMTARKSTEGTVRVPTTPKRKPLKVRQVTETQSPTDPILNESGSSGAPETDLGMMTPQSTERRGRGRPRKISGPGSEPQPQIGQSAKKEEVRVQARKSGSRSKSTDSPKDKDGVAGETRSQRSRSSSHSRSETSRNKSATRSKDRRKSNKDKDERLSVAGIPMSVGRVNGSSNEYYVEKVLGARMKVGVEKVESVSDVEYLVKWDGWPDEHNSWINDEDFGSTASARRVFWKDKVAKQRTLNKMSGADIYGDEGQSDGGEVEHVAAFSM